MKKWRSLYEIAKMPIEVLFLAFVLEAIGSFATNPYYGFTDALNNDMVTAFFEMLVRTGRFLVVNFPLLFLIRFATRKKGASTTLLASFAGYAAFLVTTIFFTREGLPDSAYSSILGISHSASAVTWLSGDTHYPLQTGILAVVIVASLARLAYNITHRKRSAVRFFRMNDDAAAVTRTVVFCFIAGFLTALFWPFVIDLISSLISRISIDTTNSMHLVLYGILDRGLGILGLGNLIRQPFWFSGNGGSWTSIAGTAATGDVSIWSAEMAQGSITASTGRFITPYYVINIFAVPAMVIALWSLETDPKQKRRKLAVMIAAAAISLLGGTLLPLEMVLLFLSPLLFVFHLLYTGMLYGALNSMKAWLGFRTGQTATLAALPGTLPEYLSYLWTPSLRVTMIKVLGVGIVSALIYFFVTRFYFHHMAMNLFQPDEDKETARLLYRALGGFENVESMDSDMDSFRVRLYEPLKADRDRLRSLGAWRLEIEGNEVRLFFGAESGMLHRAMKKQIRQS
jgi:PTS system maltose and glucose-specific IIC component